MRAHLLHLLVAAAACLGAGQARAYGAGMDIGNLGGLDFSATINRIQWKNLERAAERRADAGHDATATRFAPVAVAGGSTQARVLAAHYPPAQRAEAEKTFNTLLQGYGRIEQQFGVPRHDLAGAVAAFFAGSVMAYRNADFPDPYFKPLVAQMRTLLASNPGFVQASDAERQQMYEQMAIVGMFMATTQMALKQRPDPVVAAQLRAVGQGYLEKFLQTDAERVRLTPQGLALQ
jgi:hypothetical protein